MKRLGLFLGLLAGLSCGEDAPDEMKEPSVVGSAVIRWQLEDPMGNALNCLDVGVLETLVEVAGKPQRISCGDDQLARFERIFVGRQPVRISLLNQLSLPIDEHVGNIVLQASEETPYSHTFVIDQNTAGKGEAQLLWRIGGRSPSIACAEVGAVSVRARSRSGSVAIVEDTANCVAGEIVFTDLSTGTYIFQLTMQDADDNPVGISAGGTQAITVSPGARVQQNFNFIEVSPEDPAALLAEWTVSSSVAAIGCQQSMGDYVELELINEVTGTRISTSTAACEAGAIFVSGLAAASDIPGLGVTAIYRLIDTNLGLVDQEVQSDFALIAARTTTITVDLD